MNFIRMMLYGENLKPEWEKYRRIFMYLVFGVLTTVVNFVCYLVCDKIIVAEINVRFILWDIDLIDILNTLIAWIVAVTFAFFTNRAFVFKSSDSILKEFISFVAARIATLVVFEEGTFILFVAILENALRIPKDTVMINIFSFGFTYLYLMKLINCVFVVFANYFLSKFFVFRNRKADDSVDSDSRK